MVSLAIKNKIIYTLFYLLLDKSVLMLYLCTCICKYNYYQLKLKTARAPLPKSLPQGGGTLKENHNAYYDSGLMV
jgi:hypothetical protein